MQELTPKQNEAVTSSAAATLVIAGPGTGKTHILASRIQFLVEEQGIAPEHVLALTFTESGANAMRARVIQVLGKAGYEVAIHTFHGFAAQLIDEHPDLFGYRRDLTALSDIDRAKLIRGLIVELVRDGLLQNLTTPDDQFFYYYDIAQAISTLKREGIAPARFLEVVETWHTQFGDIPDEEKLSTRGARAGLLKQKYEQEEKRILKNKELAVLYERYEHTLAERSQYDYEDMVNRVAEGLRRSADFKEELHETYRALLVDEYQDTNGAQNTLLFELIPTDKPNVFVVGDDDQAILRFQGATIENFAAFIERFPGAAIIALEDNFRSPQFILDAALALAKNNEQRITKRLALPDKVLKARSAGAASKAFSIHEFATDLEEHSYLISAIRKLHEAGTPWREIAILTRANKEQKNVAEFLRQHEIPYTVSADQNALTEPRTASLFALVAACRNPHDNEALLSLLRHPATPIKVEDVYRVLASRQKGEFLYDTFARLVRSSSRRGRQATHALSDHPRALATLETLNALSQEQEVLSGAHWLQRVMEATGFLTWALAQEDAPYVVANIRALTDEAKRLQEGNEYVRIGDIMDHFQSFRELNVPLKPRLAQFSFSDAVRVLTAHQAKGQEFEHVFIVHAVDKHWSNKRAAGKLALPPTIAAQHEDAEDARRLFYVALTRAKQGLTITYAKTYTGGLDGTDERAKETLPALFVDELSNFVIPQPQTVPTEAFLKASITPKALVTNVQKEVVANVVRSPKFALNATSFNNFIECPNIFLYESILRVPKVKNFALTYGEAVHLALQKYFETDSSRRNLDYLLQTVQMYLDEHSTLTEAQNRALFARAEQALKRYAKVRLQNEAEPLAVEKSYRSGDVLFEDVRIAGKIDKIAPLSDSNGEVKVVDYKTNKQAKSQNAVLGRTQDKSAPAYLNQLMFYRLLLEADTSFTFAPAVFALDFVDAAREVEIPIETARYEEFTTQLKNAWNNIQTLAFLTDNKTFPRCRKCVYCAIEQV